MSNSQLWQECENLTHHSLEAFLLSILERPNVYNIYQFIRHPQISSVNEKVLAIFNIFILQDYTQLPEDQRIQLSKQKINKLKKLTILSLFQGINEIQLSAVSQAIASTKQQTIDILVQMSINGVIQIKIDQRLNKTQIHYSSVRGRQFNQNQTLALQGKVLSIINKNQSILNVIDETYSEIRNKKSGMDRARTHMF